MRFMAQSSPNSPLSYVAAPDGVAPGRGYTQVVIGTGRVVAISGQVSLDANGAVVGAGDPAAQARQVFDNLGRCLEAAGTGFENVIKLTYYVVDVALLPAVREARDQYIDLDRAPASTAVQVSALFLPELLLEIDALAVLAG
jgi:enamine deaminase RidA (YjgF/YER057c/UK114 family)